MNTTPTNNETRTEVQAPVRARVNWKEIILFVMLAYGLSWAWSGYFLPYLGELLTQSTTPTDMVERLGPAATLGTMLTPMIAALIMRIFVSKEGLKGSLGLLRSPKYYLDRKSTRLNSSHANISYAVFCLKKKKNKPAISHSTSDS